MDEPLCVEGRLIGGCIDTIAWLAGSKFGDVPSFVQRHRSEGTLLYLENVELGPTALVRALLSLKRHGWFDGLSALLIGRSAGPSPSAPASLSYVEALKTVLAQVSYPVLYDLDIGHRPPQMTLINGAIAKVLYSMGGGSIEYLAEA